MKNEIQGEGWYERFLRWAGGEEPDGPEGPEDPERQEFLEYLEYIEAHGDMEFGAYRLMRYRERREKGMKGAPPPADRPGERREDRRPARRWRPGGAAASAGPLPGAERVRDRGAGRYFSADRRGPAPLWGPGGPRYE